MKPGDKTIIAGIPVTIATDEDCERADWVVCAEVSYFADDVHTTCSACRRPVVHRWYAPKTPPKICARCFITITGGDGARAATRGDQP
jgi:hypothetical protein